MFSIIIKLCLVRGQHQKQQQYVPTTRTRTTTTIIDFSKYIYADHCLHLCFFQYHHSFSHVYIFWFSPINTLCMLHIVLSYRRNNSSCPPKSPIWRIPLQLETLMQVLRWLLGKVTPLSTYILDCSWLLTCIACINCSYRHKWWSALESSTHENAEGAVALADYQVDSANLELTEDIFGLGAVESKTLNKTKMVIGSSFVLFYWYSLIYNLYIFPSVIVFLPG